MYHLLQPVTPCPDHLRSVVPDAGLGEVHWNIQDNDHLLWFWHWGQPRLSHICTVQS